MIATTAPMSASLTEPPADNALLRCFIRLRWPIFLFVAILQLAAFSDHWRIGRDGALYRTVAHNIATGQGYTFHGQREDHIYPGLPYLLAAVETVFGPQDPLRPTASLLVMLALAGLTLFTIYHLVRLYFPQWIAICVTTGVGINREFIEQAHDLMTDVPFLLGVCITLLGIGKFSRASSPARRTLAALVILGGSMIAISMRPTFWALAIPCILLSLVGIIRSRHRFWYAVGATVALALILLWWWFDPRTAGFNPLAGKYERIVLARLHDFAATNWIAKIRFTCEEHFPLGFLGVELIFPLGTIFLLNLVAWVLIIFRKVPLWTLYILTTLLMTFLLGSKPRYYLMILPLLLVTWALSVHCASRWCTRWRFGPEILMLLGLGLATAPNLVRSIDFVLKQHCFDRTFTQKPFLQVYRDGTMLVPYQISQFLRENLPPGQRILGFESSILTLFSGHAVYHPTEILQHSTGIEWRPRLRKLNPTYILYGPDLRNRAPILNQLVDRQVVQIDPTTLIRHGGIYLARMHIPAGDPPFRPRRHKPARAAATQPVAPEAQRPTRSLRRAIRRDAAAQAALTAPTPTPTPTAPATRLAPATRPTSRPKLKRFRPTPTLTTQPLRPRPKRLRSTPPPSTRPSSPLPTAGN